MGRDKLQKISETLALLGYKEHILFMTKEEYEKEFEWMHSLSGISYDRVGGVQPDLFIASIVFNGITFHILNN